MGLIGPIAKLFSYKLIKGCYKASAAGGREDSRGASVWNGGGVGGGRVRGAGPASAHPPPARHSCLPSWRRP